MLNYKDVVDQQLQILERVETCEPTADPCEPLTGVLRLIRDYSEEDVEYAWAGGSSLKRFSERVNIDDPHPDLIELLDGQLVDETIGTFSKNACDVLKLISYGKTCGIGSEIKRILSQLITDHKYRSIVRNLEDPLLNLLYIRFISDRDLRDMARGGKAMQPVSLNALFKRGDRFWLKYPDDLFSYARHNNRFQNDIQRATQRVEHFESFGLKSMAAEVRKSIEDLTSMSKKDRHFGFNKISPTTAAVILAKMVGFGFSSSDWAYIHAYNFNYKFVDDLGQPALFPAESLKYDPRAYTYEELKEIAPNDIMSIIDLLEEFPEIGKKPLFDNYRVVVPGIFYPKEAPYRFRKPDESYMEFDAVDKAQKALDVCLLEQKEIVGALLGERDGECYFISYWV